MTNEQHNKYIAWAFLAHSGFQLLMLLLMIVFFGIIFSSQPGRGPGAPPREFMYFMITFMTVFQLLFTAPSVIAAYGLLKHKKWARLASITAGVLAAMNIPIGTTACVYAMWFFLGDNWKQVYLPDEHVEDPERGQLVDELHTRWSGMTTDEKGNITFHPVEPPDWR